MITAPYRPTRKFCELLSRIITLQNTSSHSGPFLSYRSCWPLDLPQRRNKRLKNMPAQRYADLSHDLRQYYFDNVPSQNDQSQLIVFGLIIRRTRNRALSDSTGCSCLGLLKHRYSRIMNTRRGLSGLGSAQPACQPFMYQTLLPTVSAEASDVPRAWDRSRKSAVQAILTIQNRAEIASSLLTTAGVA